MNIIYPSPLIGAFRTPPPSRLRRSSPTVSKCVLTKVRQINQLEGNSIFPSFYMFYIDIFGASRFIVYLCIDNRNYTSMGILDFLDSNNHVLAKIDGNRLLDRNNHVIGKITWSGDVQDANNHTLGHISSSGEVRNRWYSKLGSVSSNGEVRDSNNHLFGSIDSWGTVRDRNGHTLGHANGIDKVYAAVFFFFEFK